MEEGQAKNRNEAPLVTDGAAVSGDTAVQNEPVFKDERKKMSGGIIACIIILAILAIGGIAFGVYEFMQNSQKDDQIAKLQTQVTNCANAGSDETENVTVTCPDGTEVEVNNEISNDISTGEYIYVGEWGIKIKIPEDLKMVSYKFDERANEEGEFLYINGTVGNPQSIPSFVNKSTQDSWLACVSRYPLNVQVVPAGGFGQFVFSDDDYNYYISGPQAVMSSDENDIELELKTVGVIKEALSNSESYSKI